MRTVLLAISLMGLASPAFAEDCRYYAANGDKIAIDTEYIVVFTKDDNLVCDTIGEKRPDGFMVDCPTPDGEGSRELQLTLSDTGLVFDDRTWLKRCTTGV